VIALLKGSIYEINDSSLIVLLNGVGFEVFVSKPDNFSIGKDIILYIYEQVKDDGTVLYGFAEKPEKELFELVIKKVNGIGAKTALGIFKHFSKEQFIALIEEGDYKKLRVIPGIGEKTAKRIVVELGGEIKNLIGKETPLSEKLQVAKNALVSLGYRATNAAKVLKTMDDNGSIEDIIKKAIKKLSNG